MEHACPECDSIYTNKQSSTEFSDEFQIVYVCENCPTQFTVHFERSYKTVDWTDA